MATITFLGSSIKTIGDLPAVGSKAPDFILVRNDLSEVTLKLFKGLIIIINIFPSVDTPVCATSVKEFHMKVIEKKNTVVLNVSADLPFAQSRFCAAEGLERVETLSTFRSNFPKDYGVMIAEGPLRGLCSRAVIVINQEGNVIYSEQVPELSQQPDYEKALKSMTSV